MNAVQKLVEACERRRLSKIPGSTRKKAATSVAQAKRLLTNQKATQSRPCRSAVPLDRDDPLQFLAERMMRKAHHDGVPLIVEVSDGDLLVKVLGISGNGDVDPLSPPEKRYIEAFWARAVADVIALRGAMPAHGELVYA